jgi:CheY-like chemotaxis protein
MKLLVLVVDDEPDVELLFRQQFRHDLRAGRFTMEFAQSGPAALQRIADAAGVSIILILSDINMPGMSGLELLPKAKAARPDVPIIMITAYGDAETKRKALENRRGAFHQAHRLRCASQRNRHVRRTGRVTYRTNPATTSLTAGAQSGMF